MKTNKKKPVSKKRVVKSAPAHTKHDGKPLYKVLVGGKSCHGGTMEWSLPTQNADGSWTPGHWHEVDGELSICNHGLHLTWDPIQWATVPNIEVYAVEADRMGVADNGGSKVVCGRGRLIARVMGAALVAMHILTDGVHEIRDGQWYASGSAKVTAYGSAQVTAYGSAQVTAYGSAQVTASDSAQVTASRKTTLVSLPCSCGKDHEDGKSIRVVTESAVHIDWRTGSLVASLPPGTTVDVRKENQ